MGKTARKKSVSEREELLLKDLRRARSRLELLVPEIEALAGELDEANERFLIGLSHQDLKQAKLFGAYTEFLRWRPDVEKARNLLTDLAAWN